MALKPETSPALTPKSHPTPLLTWAWGWPIGTDPTGPAAYPSYKSPIALWGNGKLTPLFKVPNYM